MKILITGCGYVGVKLGELLAAQGHSVFGMRRRLETADELCKAGIQPIIGDITNLESLKAIPNAYDWVVNSVSAGQRGADGYQTTYLEGTRNLISWLDAGLLKKFVYTGSTGVYGQDDGSSVDENCPAEPASDTGRILKLTEVLLLENVRVKAFPAVILRVAGIYGPGRGYWFRQFVNGEARIEGDGTRAINMIHRDDVAGAIIAALERAKMGTIYNAVDDEPVSQIELFRWLAEATDRPMPTKAEGEFSGSRSRGVTNKRISNRKLKHELGYKFIYPSFREGFRHGLESGAWPGEAKMPRGLDRA